MKTFMGFGLLLVVLASCKTSRLQSTTIEKEKITTVLDNWHLAAAQARFDTYFYHMTADAVFIGTDPTENWQVAEFKSYSKPYFDKGKAWNFTSLQRNIYISADQKTAWFDELLDTQMKICRGSGILKKQNGKWKIAHYVLSIAIPNERTDDVIKLKTPFDDKLMDQLRSPSK